MTAETLFRALSDPTRLRCVLLLVAEGELCVCELTHALAEIQPKVSRHLALLKEAGLVTDRRQGQWVHYRLCPDLDDWIPQLLQTTLEGAGGDLPFAADRQRLTGMPDRPGKVCCA